MSFQPDSVYIILSVVIKKNIRINVIIIVLFLFVCLFFFLQ